MKIFLDDTRVVLDVYKYYCVNEDWVVVRSFDEFKSVITNFYETTGLYPTVISFDHDLGDMSEQDKTAYDCAKWFVNYYDNITWPLPKLVVHSKNTEDGLNIKTYLDNFHIAAKTHINSAYGSMKGVNSDIDKNEIEIKEILGYIKNHEDRIEESKKMIELFSNRLNTLKQNLKILFVCGIFLFQFASCKQNNEIFDYTYKITVRKKLDANPYMIETETGDLYEVSDINDFNIELNEGFTYMVKVDKNNLKLIRKVFKYEEI